MQRQVMPARTCLSLRSSAIPLLPSLICDVDQMRTLPTYILSPIFFSSYYKTARDARIVQGACSREEASYFAFCSVSHN